EDAMNRRDALGTISLGGASMLAGVHPGYTQAVAGVSPIKIRDIKTVLTAPNRIRLVVVKVETSEPGLVGWGCATFTQRSLVVKTAVDKYLRPFLIGRNPEEIEDIWQSSYVSSYWRNGPVLFNAMSGVDMALWDIKGKRAGMPVYELLGGKCRLAADLYAHVRGREDKDHFRHLRQQTSTPLAMGELFNTQQEYLPLVAERLIDFIRIHISQIGGLTMARKVAALCEFFGVRTAWHGPGDVSPVGHAA